VPKISSARAQNSLVCPEVSDVLTIEVEVTDMTNQAYGLGLARVGQDVTIWPLAKIVSPEAISIGDSVIIDDFVFIMGGKRTTIGSFVHIASFTSITGGGELILEDFTTLSSGVRVFTGTDDFLGGSLTNSAVPYPYRVPIRSFVRVKKHVIVGAQTVILPGVTIGEGVAIGANSLVRQDCEPWTIYVGSPAKPLRRRPREKILELEAQLCRELHDAQGNYIPKRQREGLT
jgi:acetyltransferase-like isoleucine patch superfamily enzyme